MIEKKEKIVQNPTESSHILTPEEGKINNSVQEKGDKVDTVPLAKFANAEELSKAYTALEAEFTRRSQKMREMEREISQTLPSQTSQKEPDDKDNSADAPHKDKWQKRVESLIEKYPVAQGLAAEIESFIQSNQEIIKNEDCLEYALINVLSKGYISNEELSKKEIDLQNSLLSNGKFKHQIISDYISSLQSNTPLIMPKGGEIPVVAPCQPKSIKEAGAIAEKLFRK